MLRLTLLRAKRFILIATLVVTLIPVLMSVALRWVNPPTSAFMLRAQLMSVIQDTPYPLHRWQSLDQIPTRMQMAVIAAEDQKFAQHPGFDVQALKTALHQVIAGKKARGGSTISQQLAKNLFLWEERSYVRKALEIPLTLLLETTLSKSRILELYLNLAQFGPFHYGVAEGAKYQFNKPVTQLDTAQAAMLACMLPAPARYQALQPSYSLKRKQRLIIRAIDNLGGARYLRQL